MTGPAFFICSLFFGPAACLPPTTADCISPKVVDGDTISCQNVDENIRVIPDIDNSNYYFDTPEPLRQHADCETEMTLGKNASSALRRIFESADRVIINDSTRVGPWSRPLMEVHIERNGRLSNITHIMQRQGYGKVYNRSEHPIDWCNGETW